MSADPPIKTEICSNFQPQAWRKTLCVNCFHTLEEHGTGDSTGEAKSKSNVKSSKKGPDQTATKVPKTLGTPAPKTDGITNELRKTTPVSKVKNIDIIAGKTDDSPTNKAKITPEHKKQPPPVAAKHVVEMGKKTSPVTTEKHQSNRAGKTILSKQSATADAGGKSLPAPGNGKSSASTTDTKTKQHGIDIKTKTASVNKTGVILPASGKTSPILSNKSVKSTTIDDKSVCKTLPATRIEDKKSTIDSDKHKATRQNDSTSKSTADDESKTKVSKVYGLLKGFDTDESNDVRGSGVKEKVRSEKADNKSVSDVSKFHSKNTQITANGLCEVSHITDANKTPSLSQNLDSTPPSSRSNTSSAEYIKHKQGKQNVVNSKDLKGKSSVQLDTSRTKDKDASHDTQQLDKSKETIFQGSLSASKGKESNANILPTRKDSESEKYADVLKTLKSKEFELDKQTSKLKEMEDKCKKLTEENVSLTKIAYDKKREDMEKNLSSFKSQLALMESRCSKLQADNTELHNRMKSQQATSLKDKSGSKEISQLERDLQFSDDECEQLKADNLELRKEMSNLKIEMEEMYDTFKENEMDEFRELQKELDITAKNCRILQFKLRKSERRNEQIVADKISYEDKLRGLQSQFTSDDARGHIRTLEEDLTMAKEVSVRLHDEIDLIEDKKGKIEEENRQLTDILEQADKKQFRMEMDIDRLKDQIADLKQKVPRSSSDQDTRDRRTLLGRIGKQSSGDQEMSQMTRDLFDSVERENDLTEQLKFTEEETKMMRKKVRELEEENERLNVQLMKQSKDSVKSSAKGYLKSNKKETPNKPNIVTNSDDSDSSITDTDTEDELNIVEIKLQLSLLEQELSLSHRKITDVEQDNENMQTQIKVLKEQLTHREQLLSVVPAPKSPNSYYQDKIKGLTIECDDLRWKVIEKDRVIERLSTQATAKARQGKLKKARSLDSDPHIAQIADLRRQLDIVSHEAELFKDRLSTASAEGEKLAEENRRLRLQQRVPSVQADDAAIENIELRDNSKKQEEENKNLQEKVRILTDSLQTLTRNPQSPSKEPPLSFGVADVTNGSREVRKQLERVLEENKTLLDKMSDLKKKFVDRVNVDVKLKDEQPSETKMPLMASDGGKTLDARDHLMENILDLEDELDEIKSKLRIKEYDNIGLESEVKSLQAEVQELAKEAHITEMELMQEVDMMHDKNAVLSNLLDIVNERADNAEKELEQQFRNQSCPSERSASAVSALSGASVGSDDVFLTPPLHGDKSMTINRDWESQIKKRIDSLERLLAEERKKVQMVEKKLRLSNPDMATSGMSDDVKLHLREKELLQGELLEHQKLMHIATDQINGLKERIYILEEERFRMRIDYGKICEELDKKVTDNEEKTENKLVPCSANTASSSPRSPIADTVDIGRLKEQCAKFKLKAEELEYKVEELNEIWRSKCSTLEKEKVELENHLRIQSNEMITFKQTVETLESELCEKKKTITEQETVLTENESTLTRRECFLHEQDNVLHQRDNDFQTLLDQVSHREETIKNMRENVRTRDERLKEKDDYIEKLNTNLEERQKDVTSLVDEVKHSIAIVKEKEVIIAILRQQISESSIRDTGSETDIEKENIRLKEALNKSQCEVNKAREEKQKSQNELDKSQKSLSEAMLMWEKKRSLLQTDLNILVEKLRLYEINTIMDRNDIIISLRDDAERYFKEKEELACEVHNLRKEYDADSRSLKEQMVKLQGELIENNQQLVKEVELETRLQLEVDRLTTKMEMADMLQEEDKILRTEYLAMKVRYEARLNTISRDYSRMIITAEKLQKEKELDKEIIQGIQKSMAQLKDNYSNDLIRWEDEQHKLVKHSKEIEDSRGLAMEMKRRILEFKEQVVEQDRLRIELINKCSTEKIDHDIERANLQGRINQLEEKIIMSSKAPGKVKDKQQLMESNWEKERSEKKHLLTTAHNLALDLQQQMKERDLEFSSTRKKLVLQVEENKQNLEKANQDRERALIELEVLGKNFVELQHRFKEIQEKAEKDQETWLRKINDLRQCVIDTKLAHTRDVNKMDDILNRLIKLRAIGDLIVVDEKEVANYKEVLTSTQPEGHPPCIFQQNILKYIKESVAEITIAAEKLASETDKDLDDKAKFRRRLSNSESNLMTEKLSSEKEEGLQQSSNNETLKHSLLHRYVSQDSSSSFGPSTMFPRLPLQQSPQLSERLPSYTSGSRSAQASRAQTPDAMDHGFHPLIAQSAFNSPSLIIPSKKLQQNSSITDFASKSLHTPISRTLTKSNSMETPVNAPIAHSSANVIAKLPTSESFTGGYTTHIRSKSDDNTLGPPSSNFNRLTPRSARKQFFENQPPLSQGFGYLSCPDRQAMVRYQKQTSLPASAEVQQVISEGDISVIRPTPQMKSSTSADERLNYGVHIPTSTGLLDNVHTATDIEQDQLLTIKPQTAKEKRKFFKKSSSLDSTVGSSIAKIGMQAIPPAAPTGFTPTDIFSTIRSKLKGKKYKESQTSVDMSPIDAIPCIETSSDSRQSCMPFQEELSSPSFSTRETEPLDSIENHSSRSLMPAGVDPKRWRSKSAERPQQVAKPVMVHSDVITPIQVWKFSETAV